MIFAFPYHDPQGIYNKVFKKNLPRLKKIFSQIFVSTTPLTVERNEKFLSCLSSEGLVVYRNEKKSNIGDHFRNALSISLKKTVDGEHIFFSFIDRVLYILENEDVEGFIQDLRTTGSNELTVFERSKKAWKSHPINYQRMEGFVNSLFEQLTNKSVEMNFCALMVDRNNSSKILSSSLSKGWEVPGEWLLLALKNSIPVITKKVDWLAWEDAFWLKVDRQKLKKQREKSRAETTKRLKNNLPFLGLLTEDRFVNLFNIPTLEA